MTVPLDIDLKSAQARSPAVRIQVGPGVVVGSASLCHTETVDKIRRPQAGGEGSVRIRILVVAVFVLAAACGDEEAVETQSESELVWPGPSAVLTASTGSFTITSSSTYDLELVGVDGFAAVTSIGTSGASVSIPVEVLADAITSPIAIYVTTENEGVRGTLSDLAFDNGSLSGSITVDLVAGASGIGNDPQAGFDRSITQMYLPSEAVTAIGDAITSTDDRGGNFWQQVAPYLKDPKRILNG